MDALWNRYRICETMDETAIHIAGSQLLSGENLDESLEKIRTMFQAPDQRVAASLFIKRYCGYLAALEAMSRWNMELVLPLSCLSFRCTDMHVFSYCPEARVQPLGDRSRDVWRAEVVQRLFADLGLMIEALSKATRLSCATMWAHVAFYTHVMYRTWLQEETCEAAQQRIREDFDYLQSSPSDWFGRTCNPLCMSFCTMKHPCREEDVLLRNMCCLNYKLGKTCYTCPRLTDEERLQKLKAFPQA